MIDNAYPIVKISRTRKQTLGKVHILGEHDTHSNNLKDLIINLLIKSQLTTNNLIEAHD